MISGSESELVMSQLYSSRRRASYLYSCLSERSLISYTTKAPGLRPVPFNSPPLPAPSYHTRFFLTRHKSGWVSGVDQSEVSPDLVRDMPKPLVQKKCPVPTRGQPPTWRRHLASLECSPWTSVRSSTNIRTNPDVHPLIRSRHHPKSSESDGAQEPDRSMPLPETWRPSPVRSSSKRRGSWAGSPLPPGRIGPLDRERPDSEAGGNPPGI